MFAHYLVSNLFCFGILLLVISNFVQSSFNEGLSGVKRKLELPDIIKPYFEIPDLNEPNIVVETPLIEDSGRVSTTVPYGLNENAFKRDKDILRQPEIKFTKKIAIGERYSFKVQKQRSSHISKKIKTEKTAMNEDYEDLINHVAKIKNCLEHSKNSNKLEMVIVQMNRHGISNRLNKLEKILTQILIQSGPYILGLDNATSDIVFDKIDGYIFETLMGVLKSSQNSLLPHYPIASAPVLPLIYKIFDYIAKYGLQTTHLEASKPSIKTVFSEKIVLQQLTLYISKVLIEKCGFIGVFLTSDIKEYIRGHPDLSHIKFLLDSLDTEHWKKIELKFLLAHEIFEWNKNVYEESFFVYKEFFRENRAIMQNLKNIDNSLPDSYEMDFTFGSDQLLKHFIKCTFTYHVQNYLKRYREHFQLGELAQQRATAFESYFTLLQKLLKVMIDLDDSRFVEPIEFNRLTGNNNKKTSFLLQIKKLKPSPEKDIKKFIGHRYIYIEKLKFYIVLKNGSPEFLKTWTSNVSRAIIDFKDEYDKFTRKKVNFTLDSRSYYQAIIPWAKSVKIYEKVFDEILFEINRERQPSEYKLGY
ncbi:hypothetical protein BY996DRAFT_7623206 [Phakopsora pachyrhizi]|nr:hypothetical protein BY996DRAFT_7623206 [Phakopsora pachyrhizi]